MEEEISRNIGAVMTEGESPDLTDKDSNINTVYQIYEISAMTSRMIVSVKVALIPSRNVSETKATVQYVPQANIFQSKGRHLTMLPEEMSERWQIGLEQAREKIAKITQILTRSAVMSLARRFKVYRVFQTKRFTGMRDTYTMEVRVKSIGRNQRA